MSPGVLTFVFLICGYVILSAWALDIQNKVDTNNNNRDNTVLDKRDLKADSTLAKYIDPSPEYYRGPPGSSSSYGSERDRIRDRDGYVVGLQRPPYAGSSGTGYDNRYPSPPPQLLPPRGTPTPLPGGNRYGGFQDRIGYGNGYGSGPHSSNNIPYGQPIPLDFPSSYDNGPPGNPYYHPQGYGSNIGSSYWTKKGFPGIEHFFPSADASDYYYPGKSQFTKSLLVPLIGGALLGITAALVANPALLHLGMLTGKRRRRDTSGTGEEVEARDGTEKVEHAHGLAYRAYRDKKLL